MRTVDPRLWTDPTFRALSLKAKLVFLEWATGPVGGNYGDGAAACGLTVEEFSAAADEFVDTGLITSDLVPIVEVPLLYIGPTQHSPAVYFIQSGDFGEIKIGWTADIHTRVATLRTANPSGLSVLAMVRGGREAEARLHAKFAHLRTSGEWFAPAPELIEYVRSIHRGDAEEVA